MCRWPSWGVRGAGHRHRGARHPGGRRRPRCRDGPARPAGCPHQRRRRRPWCVRFVRVGGGDVDDRVVGRPRWHGPPPGRRHRGSGPQARPPVAQPGVVAGRGVVERPGRRPLPPISTPIPSSCSRRTRPRWCRAWWSCRPATSPSPCAPGAKPPPPTAIPSPNARMRCTCPGPSTTAGAPTAPWAPRPVNCWPPPCAWPRPGR
jgi:hypothetical protein